MKNLNKLSTELCYYLRHKPEALGITLTSEGYVEVETFLQALNAKGTVIDLVTLEGIIQDDKKCRYGVLMNPYRIRCNQGHSTDQVNLRHTVKVPPTVLFHGTAEKNLPSIRKKGLIPGTRHHVHLSADRETALSVGSRHGTPVILEIDTKRMVANGYQFMLSDNGVWLIGAIAPDYIKF